MISVIYKGRGRKRVEFIASSREWKEFVTYEHSVERWYA